MSKHINNIITNGNIAYLEVVKRDNTRYIYIFDTVDIPNVSKFKWHIGPHNYCVSVSRASGKLVNTYLHQVIIGLTPGSGYYQQVDHISSDRFDNRKSNLRVATPQQNMINRKGRSKTGQKGVYPVGSKWVAHICYGGKSNHLGTFELIEDAAMAYNEAALNFYGEFAYLNSAETV
jgi:hypothetical protein